MRTWEVSRAVPSANPERWSPEPRVGKRNLARIYKRLIWSGAKVGPLASRVPQHPLRQSSAHQDPDKGGTCSASLAGAFQCALLGADASHEFRPSREGAPRPCRHLAAREERDTIHE